MLPAVGAQGDLMSPLQALVQVDTIANNQIIDEHERELPEGSTILYKYMGWWMTLPLGLKQDTKLR